MAAPIVFGNALDGSDVLLVKLAGEGIAVNLMSYGASVQDLRLASHAHPMVLGFSEFENYLKHPNYFGATVGRCANRIAGGRFEIADSAYQTFQNEKQRGNTLHGANACSSANWELIGHGEVSAQFKLVDPDGNFGFPGNCEIIVNYSLEKDATLRIEYEAISDAPTPVNIAHHSYFNLNGSGTILDHEIEILADHYLPVDDNLIPTGEIKPIKDTPFDFTKGRKIRDAGGDDFLHDHNYCLQGTEGEFRKIVCLSSNHSGITMNMSTSEIGLQFYTSKGLNVETEGLDGQNLSPFSGICLEAQKWPDGINRDTFPEVILHPGDKYKQVTEYQFSS